mgnify:CR=1 FL=1
MRAQLLRGDAVLGEVVASGEEAALTLQDLPAGAFDVTTKVTLNAVRGYQQAGLIIYGILLFCHGLAASADGARLASAGKDGTIRIWDATPPSGSSSR